MAQKESRGHISGAMGELVLGVRKDADAALSDDIQYHPLLVNATGMLKTTGGGASDALGTDGSTGPAKAMSIAGTESGGNLQEIAVDSSGNLQVDVLAMPTTTVTGTVTANLGTVDNAKLDDIDSVLDDIDAVLDTIKVDTEAVETALENSTPLHNTHADMWSNSIGNQTGNHGGTVVKSAGSSGKCIYITDIVYSATAASQIFILHNELASGAATTNTNQIAPPAASAAAGVVAIHFNTPIKMVADEDLQLTTVGGSANHAITVCGYLK